MRALASRTHIEVPASQCYWAVIQLPPAARSRSRGHRAETLRHLFQTSLPAPLDDVHVTLLRLTNDAFLACGIDRALLATLVGSDPDTLGPAAPPPDVCDGVAGPVGGINLLHGEFTPAQSLARASRRRLAIGAATLLACVLVIIGAERRTRALEERATSHAIATDRLTRDHGASEGTLPPLMRLTAELRRLSTTAAQLSPGALPRSATLDLSDLLSRWPLGSTLTADSIRVEDGHAALGVRGVAPEDVSALLAHLTRDGTWESEQPHLNRDSQGVQARVTLRASTAVDRGRPQ
jgi:hypothetical protein